MRTPRTLRWIAGLALAGVAALGGVPAALSLVGSSPARTGVDADGMGHMTPVLHSALSLDWEVAWFEDYGEGDALDADL
jgi:hypothetical protein